MKWKLIFQNELNSYFKSDKALFFAHIILIFSFGSIYASRFSDITSDMGVVWLVSFSVIVSSNFSYSTFVSERMNGMLEILLVSGIQRKDILLGKVLFATLFSSLMGIFIYIVALFSNVILNSSNTFNIWVTIISVFPIYLSACMFNITVSAWLSVKLPNPRILTFINLFVIVFIASVNMVVTESLNYSGNLIIPVLSFGAIVFYFLALKEYRSENVTKPLIF